eukprot:3139564-Pleurochrysis_carterae.AAC.1
MPSSRDWVMLMVGRPRNKSVVGGVPALRMNAYPSAFFAARARKRFVARVSFAPGSAVDAGGCELQE